MALIDSRISIFHVFDDDDDPWHKEELVGAWSKLGGTQNLLVQGYYPQLCNIIH